MRLAESAMIVWSTADSAVQRTRRGSGFVIPITRFDSPLQNSSHLFNSSPISMQLPGRIAVY
jgi:hypothetical protein